MIEWRYGDQLDWRLVLVGLSEDTSRYAEHGFTPLRMASAGCCSASATGCRSRPNPKPRLSASSRACRAVIAARRQWPGSEWRVFRALQLANFNTPLLFDDDEQLREALSAVPGIDADQIVASSTTRRARRLRAGQGPDAHRGRFGHRAAGQGRQQRRSGALHGALAGVRDADGRRLEAGGFQPVEAYDVLIANLDPTLERQAPPEDPARCSSTSTSGSRTQEVAALMTHGNDRPDRIAAEAALLALVDEGRAERHALGGDALWIATIGPPASSLWPPGPTSGVDHSTGGVGTGAAPPCCIGGLGSGAEPVLMVARKP